MSAHKSDTLVNTPKITFGMIVLNGEPFIKYNLRALYPYAHQIIVVEGACPSSASVATPDGHSTDGTLTTLQRFQTEEDHGNKVLVIIAEDEGHRDGFWSEKDEMSEAYAKRAAGNYLWQVDSDEFYLPRDMRAVIDILTKDPEITAITFPMRTFWGSPDYLVDSFFLRNFDVHRVFAWSHGYRYTSHRPPTVVDGNGRDLRAIRPLTAKQMARRGIFLYHYELLFPKQVMDKCFYYTWSERTTALQGADVWARECYFTLKHSFRVHMVYQHLSWLERFTGKKPPQVAAMMEAVKHGEHPGVDLRCTDDIETLLWSHYYRLACIFLKSLLPLNKGLLHMKQLVRNSLKDTPLWRMIQDFRNRLKGGPVAINQESVSKNLANGWKSSAIPSAQLALTSRELSDMYKGKIVRPFQVLADAVKATGCENGEIIEVGCSSGYYYEVLRHLLERDIKYKGIDYSEAMIMEARRRYPEKPFETGDATSLPCDDDSCNILISGCVLLHVPGYPQAIAECARVSRRWVIFHRTPVVEGKTQYFKKLAYGVPCVEIHFGEKEFADFCIQNNLSLHSKFTISDGCITFVYEKSMANPKKGV